MAALTAEATAPLGATSLDSRNAENDNTLVSEPNERGTPRAALVEAFFSEDVELCRQLLDAHPDLVNAGLRSRVHERVSGYDSAWGPIYQGAYQGVTPLVFASLVPRFRDREKDGEVRTLSREGLAVLALLVERGAGLESIAGADDWTSYILIEVCHDYDSPEAMDLLVRAGADIHTRKLDQCNRTLLQVAAGRGAIGAVGFLLDRGVPMNWSDDPEGQEVNGTPLHAAAANGRYQVVECLLSRGALSDLEKADRQGRSPLLCAASGFSDPTDAPPSRQLDWEKTVRLLVDSGADLAVSDGRDLGSAGAGSTCLTDTPLGYVSCWGSADIVRYLASKGSDIHQQRSYPKDRCFPYGVGGDKATPVHRGAHHWNADGVRALLELGADPDATDEYGRQPLHWAAIGQYLSQGSLGSGLRCISRLWSALLTMTEPQSPAHSAKLNALESTIKQLIVHTASIDRQDIFGRTPLHYAASMKLVGAVALLVESGADPGQTDDQGRTALHHLADPLHDPHTHEPLDQVLENEHLHAILAARIRDDNVDLLNHLDNTGSTALHNAAISASDAAVTLLLSLGADANLPDNREGSTPLHLAARRADWVTARLGTYAPDEYAAWSRRAARIKALLLAAGADASRRDAAGRVPADVEVATEQELREGRARYLERLAAPPRRDVGMGRGFRGSGRGAAGWNR